MAYNEAASSPVEPYIYLFGLFARRLSLVVCGSLLFHPLG